jgi:hypothetical protein
MSTLYARRLRTNADWFNINSVYPDCPVGVLAPPTANCPNAIHLQGDAGRNSLEEPGINNWDLSIFKHTRISERLDTELRAEFYNAWNHIQFSAPNASLTPRQFGVIAGVLEPPRQIQLAFKLLF